jgi:GNAT superfamily N-acetyltransferase
MTDWDSRILRFWAAELNAEPQAFEGNALTVQPVLDRGDRLIVYSCGEAKIVRVPRRLRPPVGAAPASASLDVLADWLGAPLEPRYTDWIAYATTPCPPLETAVPARPVTRRDEGALQQLLAACTDSERMLAQITIDDPLIAGCFNGDTLVAVASTLDTSRDIADIGVLTHPAWRGRGLAAGLAVRLRNMITAKGRVAQYTTMASNGGSVRTLQKAGFDVFLVEAGFAIAERTA